MTFRTPQILVGGNDRGFGWEYKAQLPRNHEETAAGLQDT